MVDFIMLNLESFFNVQAFTSQKYKGDLDGWGWAFPADEFAQVFGPSFKFYFKGIPFKFGNPYSKENAVKCRGQIVRFPSSYRIKAFYLIATATNGSQVGFIKLNSEKGSEIFAIAFTDWCWEKPAFTDVLFYRFSHRVPPDGLKPALWFGECLINFEDKFTSMTLPNNSNLAIFAITLETFIQGGRR